MRKDAKRPKDLTLDSLVSKRSSGFISIEDPRDCIQDAFLHAGEVHYTLERVHAALEKTLDTLDECQHWELWNELYFWCNYIGTGDHGLVQQHNHVFYDNLSGWFGPAIDRKAE